MPTGPTALARLTRRRICQDLRCPRPPYLTSVSLSLTRSTTLLDLQLQSTPHHADWHTPTPCQAHEPQVRLHLCCRHEVRGESASACRCTQLGRRLPIRQRLPEKGRQPAAHITHTRRRTHRHLRLCLIDGFRQAQDSAHQLAGQSSRVSSFISPRRPGSFGSSLPVFSSTIVHQSRQDRLHRLSDNLPMEERGRDPASKEERDGNGTGKAGKEKVEEERGEGRGG